jgi:hypothetical protein
MSTDPERQQDTEWLDEDELTVLQAFAEQGVRYLIIGGRAVPRSPSADKRP